VNTSWIWQVEVMKDAVRKKLVELAGSGRTEMFISSSWSH
jgi:hypothetical protein